MCPPSMLDESRKVSRPEAGRERQSPDRRRQQLIDAAIAAIAEHGLSKVTLQQVAGLAGLTAGMVNFHFESKQALLNASLQHLADEYGAAFEAAVARAAGDPEAAVIGIVQTSFDERISAPRKVAVWYAFWGETRARENYLALCGRVDQAQQIRIEALIAELVRREGLSLDARTIGMGLSGLMDGLWQDILVQWDRFDRGRAIDLCRRYLRNFFPNAFDAPATWTKPRTSRPAAGEVPALPGWTYASDTVHAAERRAIHRPAWHVLCHVSELPEPGAYRAADLLGERAFAIRGEDGAIRTFHNVCPHGACPVVRGAAGTRSGPIRCPCHGWSFSDEGEPKGNGRPGDEGCIPRLAPIESELLNGFVFIRFEAGIQPTIQRFASRMNGLGLREMVPIGEGWSQDIAADWKAVWDDWLVHGRLAAGHASCTIDDMSRTVWLGHGGGHGHRDRCFIYPSTGLDVHAGIVGVQCVMPTAPGRARVSVRFYAHRNEQQQTADDRWRIRCTGMVELRERLALVEEVQKGLLSSACAGGVPSAHEHARSRFHAWVLSDVPGLLSSA